MLDLSDPDTYVAGVPHEVFAELRRTEPVYWQDMRGEPGYWAVLTHAGVEHVAKHPDVFSSSDGGVVLEDLDEERLAQMRNMLLAMDPPRHSDYRRPLVQRFQPRALSTLEEPVREMCRAILSDAAEQGDVELVNDVAGLLPSRVLGELMGLPREDWAHVHHLAELVTHGQDPDYVAPDDDSQPGTVQMALYAYGLAVQRRAEEPRDDLTSMLLETEFGGARMTEIDFASFFVQLVTAGNDTTQTLLSSGLLALLEHPDQLALLRADLSLIPEAVEEMLRYANPLHYFRRTATADTEVEGVSVVKGDKVAMYYTSANRDEQVFERPDDFDVRRFPNRHLSLGVGEHFCLGAHLARLEARVFFEELLATFPTIELTGPPTRVRSNLNNAYKSIPVHLSRS